MSFIENIKQRAKKDIKTIILPEAEATKMVLKEKYAKIILLGNEERIKNKAKENSISLEGAEIIDPKMSSKHDEYAGKLYE